MAVNASNIILEPCDVLIGRRERTAITFVADSSSSLNDTYFTFGSAGSSSTATHYAWYSVAAAGSDPAIAGLTGIEIAIAEDAAASSVASATETEIEAIDGFNTVLKSGVLYVENKEIGTAFEADDTGSTGFTFVQESVGFKEDLGGTSGGTTVSPDVTRVDVKADQLGDTLLDEILNGTNATVAMSLAEVTAANWSTIVGKVIGDEITPASGTKVIGYGESKRFVNLSNYSVELVLKPSNSSDDLRNITLFKTSCIPSSINFSGTDLQVMEVEFKAYRDVTKDPSVNLMAFGDTSQNLLV